MYFVKSGELELSKQLRIDQTNGKAHILRMVSEKSLQFIEKLFSGTGGLLFSEENRHPQEQKRFYEELKDLRTKQIVLTSNHSWDSFGFCEAIVGCPYRVFTVTCKSQEAECVRVHRDEFFERMRGDKNIDLVFLTNQKFRFFSDRIENIVEFHGNSFPEFYRETQLMFENKQILKMKMKG